MNQLGNFIGGEFSAPFDGRYFTHMNPSNGQPSVEVPDSDQLDLVRAVQAANKAIAPWQRIDSAGRAALLLKIADLLEAKKSNLARIQAKDQGTPVQAAEKVSLPSAIEAFRYYARVSTSPESRSWVSDRFIATSNRLPIGLVGIISTWSDPIANLALRLAPALAAGNCVIVKPSEFAPESAQAFAQVIAEAGLPPGVINFVQGRGETVGAALVQHPAINTICFIGQSSTGQKIMRDSVEFMKRTQLALSARNPVLVFAENDLPKTAAQVAALCAGTHPAACLRGSRLFIQETVYDQFRELFQASVEKLVVGDPLDPATQVGPLAHLGLVERYKQALSLSLQERGKPVGANLQAELELPEHLRSGFFVRPASVYDFTLCSTLQQEEIIGPFTTITSFKYQHDAIKHANNNPLGRAAFVFHGQPEKLQKIASKLEASQVYLNGIPGAVEPALAVHGMKQSGFGTLGGIESLEFVSRATSVSHLLG